MDVTSIEEGNQNRDSHAVASRAPHGLLDLHTVAGVAEKVGDSRQFGPVGIDGKQLIAWRKPASAYKQDFIERGRPVRSESSLCTCKGLGFPQGRDRSGRIDDEQAVLGLRKARSAEKRGVIH